MKQTLKDVEFEGKRVLVRVDFNVPIKDGVIKDDSRIKAAIPTIKYLIKNNAKIVLCSHLGKINHKDKEKTQADKKKNDMANVVDTLSSLLNKKVKFSQSVVGKEVEEMISSLKEQEVLLLQNTRYEEGEEKNSDELSLKMIKNIDAYVMDAFGSAHRKHASTYGVPLLLNKEKKETCVGFLVEKEVEALSKCVEASIHPYVAVLGGAKVSDKIKVIDGLLDKADKIIIGGAMAYTFLKAKGYEVGNSKVEEEQIEYAKSCLSKGKDKIVLPFDHVVADRLEEPTFVNVSMDENILEGYMGLDIGPRTIEKFSKELEGAKMVFWNGPLGAFENKLFSQGTKKIAQKITSLKDCFSVVGGGDSAAACKECGLESKFSHVSTGGGASLEMIENDGHLPGIDVIVDRM